MEYFLINPEMIEIFSKESLLIALDKYKLEDNLSNQIEIFRQMHSELI